METSPVWRLLGVLLVAGSGLEAAEPIFEPGSYPPGNYYLANDITIESGTALTFTASVVSDRAELNLNGKTIGCTGPDTIGIAGSGPSNLIIVGGGGSWIDGCRIGVSSTRQTRVQEVIFTNIRYMAMNLSGPWSRVILNEVEGVAGVSDEAYSVGINAGGPFPIIRGNRFVNFYRQDEAPGSLAGEGVPILLNATANGGLVELNYVVNDVVREHTIGIWAGGGSHIIRNNTVRNFQHGIQGAGPVLVQSNTVSTVAPVEGSVGILFEAPASIDGNTVVGY